MLPSRGLRLSQRIVKPQSPCSRPVPSLRNFSTQGAFNARSSLRWQPRSVQTGIPRPRHTVVGTAAASGIRFASTTPAVVSTSSLAASPSDASPFASSPAELTSDPGPVVTSTPIDTLEFSNVGATNITEHIGYLRELGLDFGWGPTSLMQWYYEHVHILSGLPWWSSILVASLIYRLGVLAYPNMMTSDQTARLKAVAPHMQPLSAKQREAMQKGDQMAMMQAQRELSLLRTSAGISFKKQFGFLGLQAILGYGTFHLMREMATLPVPGLETQGIAWISDLTIPDPYFILPAALAFTMHFVLKLGGAGAAGDMAPTADTAAMSSNVRSVLIYGMPAFVGLFMLWMPACLQLSFAATSVLGMVQGRLMMRPWFREVFGLYPLEDAPDPFTGRVNGRVVEVQKSTSPRDLSSARDVMRGYQAPSVAGVAKALPAGATRQGGALSMIARPFTRAAKFFSGLKGEAEDWVAKQSGGPKKDARMRAYEQKATELEARRKREIEEEKQWRESEWRKREAERKLRG